MLIKFNISNHTSLAVMIVQVVLEFHMKLQYIKFKYGDTIPYYSKNIEYYSTVPVNDFRGIHWVTIIIKSNYMLLIISPRPINGCTVSEYPHKNITCTS